MPSVKSRGRKGFRYAALVGSFAFHNQFQQKRQNLILFKWKKKTFCQHSGYFSLGLTSISSIILRLCLFWDEIQDLDLDLTMSIGHSFFFLFRHGKFTRWAKNETENYYRMKLKVGSVNASTRLISI